MWLVAAPALLPPSAGATVSRVRPLDHLADAIVADGIQRSPTIAGLVDALEARDVVVYIRTRIDLPHRGMLAFAGRGGPLTYVLVEISPRQGTSDRIATLAHELTHALEVAREPSPVASADDLESLYRRIGVAVRDGEYESAQALAIERVVMTEITSATARRQPPAAKKSPRLA
jgi:hypothetical protein